MVILGLVFRPLLLLKRYAYNHRKVTIVVILLLRLDSNSLLNQDKYT